MAVPQPVTVIRYMGALTFDAVFEERHSSELEVTDNPVETGVVVSDHAYMKPLRCTISAGVSDTPLIDESSDLYASAQARSKEAFKLLQELQAKAEPFDVQTGLKLYKNMVISSIEAGQDKDTANALVFQAELREIIIVSTQAVTYPPRKAGATKQQADKKAEKGEQQGTQNKSKSVAKSLKDLITGG